MTLVKLYPELINIIGSYLPLRSLLSLRSTCKYLRDMTFDQYRRKINNLPCRLDIKYRHTLSGIQVIHCTFFIGWFEIGPPVEQFEESYNISYCNEYMFGNYIYGTTIKCDQVKVYDIIISSAINSTSWFKFYLCNDGGVFNENKISFHHIDGYTIQYGLIEFGCIDYVKENFYNEYSNYTINYTKY